jgi:hypothetical protein
MPPPDKPAPSKDPGEDWNSHNSTTVYCTLISGSVRTLIEKYYRTFSIITHFFTRIELAYEHSRFIIEWLNIIFLTVYIQGFIAGGQEVILQLWCYYLQQ